jgi:hypothetical protein
MRLFNTKASDQALKIIPVVKTRPEGLQIVLAMVEILNAVKALCYLLDVPQRLQQPVAQAP